MSDLRTNAPVRPDGYFRIGSPTKVYTAVMILQLAQEHRIDLDQSVQHYLPGLLPAGYPDIPVHTLLDHTSGLPSVDIPGLTDPHWILEVNGVTVWGKTGSRHGYSSGIFATRDLARKVAYSVNPTVKSEDGPPAGYSLRVHWSLMSAARKRQPAGVRTAV